MGGSQPPQQQTNIQNQGGSGLDFLGMGGPSNPVQQPPQQTNLMGDFLGGGSSQPQTQPPPQNMGMDFMMGGSQSQPHQQPTNQNLFKAYENPQL